MQNRNITSWVIGVIILVAAALVGYWFWVPDVGALRTWSDFLKLPTMKCEIGDVSVQGLSGTMYIMHGRLRADYIVEGNGVSSRFQTIVYEDGTAYTWADDIDFAQRSKLTLGGGSTEENLFKISRCKRVWSLNPDLFEIPIGMDFKEKGAPQATSTQEVAPQE